MTTAIVARDSNELADRNAAALATAGRQANQAAANYVIVEYMQRRASKTIETQAAALALFADYLDEIGQLGGAMADFAASVATWADGDDGRRPDPDAWRGVTWGIVEGFVKWMLQQGYAIGTVNNRLSAVKVYAKMAAKAGAIDRLELLAIKDVSGYGDTEGKRIDERRDVTRVGDKKADHVSLTHDQAQALKGMTTHEGPQGSRDRLLMCLLLDHGLRVSEVVLLRVTDFNLETGELSVYRPKVDKRQTHEMTADTLKAARGYLLNYAPAMGRALVGSVKGGALTGKPMCKRAISKRVRYLGRKLLDIDNLSPHDCRHFWATYWSKRLDRLPRGILQLQEAGGWSSLTMPRHYAEEAAIANEGMT